LGHLAVHLQILLWERDQESINVGHRVRGKHQYKTISLSRKETSRMPD
jgi:hypothetical protein